MKKVCYWLLLFAAASLVCAVAGYGIARYTVREERAVPNTEIETQTADEAAGKAAANQEGVRSELIGETAPEEAYFLVSEAGFLLVFASDRSTICLYTHIPVTDFPEKERERLMAGIWFSSMMDIYHYLESYTS